MKQHLDLFLALAAVASLFGGLIWKMAILKSDLEKQIDRVRENLDDKLDRVNNDLRIHLTEYAGKKEFLEYHLHGLSEKIDHKFNRCWSEIKQNQAYLSKHGFVPREHQE